ncbi:hypothetical protein ACFU8I_02850 [Streptomyces sp. NPDC057540]|uniref:hypothetical protein n=1 Tax=Streptomyces sp. NPDC057540 TaxID=3346160 RepID=UPI003692EAA7
MTRIPEWALTGQDGTHEYLLETVEVTVTCDTGLVAVGVLAEDGRYLKKGHEFRVASQFLTGR